MIVEIGVVCTRDNEQFLVITGQFAVSRLTEIAGVRFLSVYQQHGRADFAAVLQDRHIQERQRGKQFTQPCTASLAPLANATASVSELPPLRGLEEMISTFLFIVEHSLHFYILCLILIVMPEPDFRSRYFLKIFGRKFMYSIGQVAEMFGLPISTLRYYDKQGLFPNMERVYGIRKFGDTEIEALLVIECLKKAGMEIKDIRQFMDWCVEWPSTYPQRKALFEEQRSHMEAELEQIIRADMENAGQFIKAYIFETLFS